MVLVALVRSDARRAGAAAWGLASGVAVVALIAPALWNGFPLIFPDTGGYLLRPLTGTLELGRSALYGLFLLAGAPLAFWPIVAAQAALMAWLIALTLRAHGLGGRPWLLAARVAALAAATSLPWFTAQLMPDVLFPAGVLALYLLAFGESLRTGERVALAAVIAFAIASHMALLGLALGLIAALPLVRLLRDFPTPRLAAAAGATLAGLALAPLSNLAITGSFAFTPGGTNFLFNRLVEDGFVSRYLNRECPDPTLRICDYRDEISTGYDDWLWKYDTPFWKLGGWQGHSSEERRIILATLMEEPLTHLSKAIGHSLGQFASFATEVTTDRGPNAHTIGAFHDALPQLAPDLMAARQQTDDLDVAPLNLVHVPVAALSIAGLAAALAGRRRLGVPPRAAALAATVLLALAVNAVVCGVFSHPAARYQSRLIALAPLAMMIILVERRRVC